MNTVEQLIEFIERRKDDFESMYPKNKAETVFADEVLAVARAALAQVQEPPTQPAASQQDAEDARDAKRYRWMRVAAFSEDEQKRIEAIAPHPDCPEDFDAAIDAAMKDG